MLNMLSEVEERLQISLDGIFQEFLEGFAFSHATVVFLTNPCIKF